MKPEFKILKIAVIFCVMSMTIQTILVFEKEDYKLLSALSFLVLLYSMWTLKNLYKA